jgi:DNA repair protein RadA/Sms
VVFGEVGLAGEVRPVQRGQERLREAAKLGFTHALIPEANNPKQPIAGLNIVAVQRIADAVARFRDGW